MPEQKPCAVKWCVALAKAGQDRCPIHIRYPDLAPEELERTDDDVEPE